MNAINSMTSESWCNSFTRREQLRVPVSPQAAYRFNTHAVLDTEFRESAKDRLRDLVTQHDLPESFNAALDHRSVQTIVLGREQLAVFDELGLQDAMRRSATAAGYNESMPPFICTALSLVCTVFVVVVQQNVSDQEPVE